MQASETSTGAMHDVRAMGAAVAKTDAILVVDAITGFGTMPLDIDGWGLDVVIGGSQKAFMIPPGLAFMAVSPKAWKLAETATLPHYYFNLKKEKKSGDAGESSWTPATSLILALAEALRYVKQLGMPNLIENAQLLATATRAAVQKAGAGAVRAGVAGLLGDRGEGAGGARFRRHREGIPQPLRRHHRQRPGHHEGPDFPHRAPGLFRFRGPVRGCRGARNHSQSQRSAGAVWHRRGRRPGRSTNKLNMPKILIAEPLAAAGIEFLRAQPGWDVVVSNPKEYVAAPGGFRRTAGAQRGAGEPRRAGARARNCA